MDDDARVRKKRRDVKVHYIRRENNIYIVSDRPSEQKENAPVHTDKNQ